MLNTGPRHRQLVLTVSQESSPVCLEVLNVPLAPQARTSQARASLNVCRVPPMAMQTHKEHLCNYQTVDAQQDFILMPLLTATNANRVQQALHAATT